jgi:hypothetical protein
MTTDFEAETTEDIEPDSLASLGFRNDSSETP